MSEIVSFRNPTSCCCCFQTPGDAIPWYEHDEETQQPIGWFCWSCGDIVFTRYPFLNKETARGRAQEERFRTQVVKMGRIKLGVDAKDFYPQEVVMQRTYGWTMEEALRPLTSSEFKEEYGKAPEEVPGANCVPLPTGRGDTISYWLDRDPAARPKVTMWHENVLCCNERRMGHEDQVSEGQGLENMQSELPTFLNQTFGSKSVPTVMDLRAQVASLKAGGAAAKGGGKGGGSTGALVPMLPSGGAPGPAVDGGRALPQTRRASRRQAARASPATDELAPKRPKTGNDYLQLPSIADCLLNKHGRGKLSGAQVLYHCHQAIEGANQRGQMDQKAYLKEVKAYRTRVFASGLAPGSIEKASDEEVTNCYVELMRAKIEDPLPERFWYNMMKRQAMKVTAKPDWRANGKEIFAFTDPQVGSSFVEDALPVSLKQISPEKLASSDRWVVSQRLWLEVFFPAFLQEWTPPCEAGGESVPAAIRTLLHCFCGFKAAIVKIADPSSEQSALVECFALCCAPWQDCPLTSDQMRLLQQAASPEEAPSHVQVLDELFNATWQKALRKTMQFTIMEVQHQEKIDGILAALGGHGSGVPEPAADTEIWNTLMSNAGWNAWKGKIRPLVANALRKAIADRISRRLSSTGPEPDSISQMVRVCAWMETHDAGASSPWGALHVKAQENLLHATATARTASFKNAMQAYVDTDEDSEADLSNLIATCNACKGLVLDEAEIPPLEKSVRKVLQRSQMDEATADLASQLMALRPSGVQGGDACDLLRAAVRAVKCGAPLHHRFGGEASELAVATPAGEDLQSFREFTKARDEYEQAWKNAGHNEEPGLVAIWANIASVADLISKSQARSVEQQLQENRAQFENKLQDLAEMYESLRWQKELPSSAVWADVVREIEYRFWRSQGGEQDSAKGSDAAGKPEMPPSVLDKLDQLYGDVDALWTDHVKQCEACDQQPPADLKKKWVELVGDCQVLNTEEYCVRQYVDLGDASSKKLSRRQMQAVNFWDRVHPLVAAKVQEVTGM